MTHSNTYVDKGRLTTLADGIFAIVMTLLVIEIRVPELFGIVSNRQLWMSLTEMLPVLFSYLLSFVMLFTYWRAHHFIVSGYARTIDSKLININALFFFFVALAPFTSALLGRYSETQLAVVLFSIQVVLLGVLLYWMRNHILLSSTIQNEEVPLNSLWHSNIRVAVPIVFATLAILISFFSIAFSLVSLTIAVIFNLFTQSTKAVDWLLSHVFNVTINS